MSNYLLSLQFNFAARKSSLKNSQREAKHIMQRGHRVSQIGQI